MICMQAYFLRWLPASSCKGSETLPYMPQAHASAPDTQSLPQCSIALVDLCQISQWQQQHSSAFFSLVDNTLPGSD